MAKLWICSSNPDHKFISATVDNFCDKCPPYSGVMKIVKCYLSDVIGYWDKAALNVSSYYVLHNEARPGTMMDVYNPMLKTHIKAKVLGKIPVGTYASDIQIIISPSIAKDLKILDGRFKVNIKYEQ